MLELFLKGGPVMYPLLLCSVLGVAIVVERVYFFWSQRADNETLMDTVRAALSQGRILEAAQAAKREKGPVAAVLAAAVAHYGKSRRVVTEQVEKVGQEEIYRLEKGLTLLDVLVGIAPLLGLLGTVTGIIRSFNVLGAMQGVAEPAVLSSGIAEALVTTAAGLLIAIPLMAVNAYFYRVVDRRVLDMNQRSTEIIALVAEREG